VLKNYLFETIEPEFAGSVRAGDILVAGSPTLVHALTRLGLVDEYRLMVHPVVLGKGKRLFGEDNAGTDLELVESRKAGPDVLLLIYRPAKTAAE